VKFVLTLDSFTYSIAGLGRNLATSSEVSKASVRFILFGPEVAVSESEAPALFLARVSREGPAMLEVEQEVVVVGNCGSLVVDEVERCNTLGGKA
jgi:hypothetical protein